MIKLSYLGEVTSSLPGSMLCASDQRIIVPRSRLLIIAWYFLMTVEQSDLENYHVVLIQHHPGTSMTTVDSRTMPRDRPAQSSSCKPIP